MTKETYYTQQHYELAYEWFLELRGDHTYAEIERMTGVSKKTLSRWNTKGRTKRTYHNTQHLEQEIAETLHVSTDTIRKYFPGTAWTLDQRIQFITDVRKITGASRGISSEKLMKAKKLLLEGYTIPEVARKVAVSDPTLYKYFPEFKMSRVESARKAVATRIERRSQNR